MSLFRRVKACQGLSRAAPSCASHVETPPIAPPALQETLCAPCCAAPTLQAVALKRACVDARLCRKVRAGGGPRGVTQVNAGRADSVPGTSGLGDATVNGRFGAAAPNRGTSRLGDRPAQAMRMEGRAWTPRPGSLELRAHHRTRGTRMAVWRASVDSCVAAAAGGLMATSRVAHPASCACRVSSAQTRVRVVSGSKKPRYSGLAEGRGRRVVFWAGLEAPRRAAEASRRTGAGGPAAMEG